MHGRALVFCGQGSHRKGMGVRMLASQRPDCKAAKIWNSASDRMLDAYHVHLGTLIQENPAYLDIAHNALNWSSTSSKEAPSGHDASTPLLRVREPSAGVGVMHHTFFAQPAMVAAQLVSLQSLRDSLPKNDKLEGFTCIAGHSLGEFTALAAAGVFPPDVAVDLVFRRGVLMYEAMRVSASRARDSEFMMFACNPLKAQLDRVGGADVSPGEVFSVLVELVGQTLKQTSSFVELVNANILNDQYVVAGDAIALAVLGKVLDPQFRANSGCASNSSLSYLVQAALSAVKLDKSHGVLLTNDFTTKKDFVPGSAKRYGKQHTCKRVLRGPDDGHTLSLEDLSHLTLEGEGRSGLKRKSWFVPLQVATPFHSSLLRRAMDAFYPQVLEALPSASVIRKAISCSSDASAATPKWVTNLTGTVFSDDRSFRDECADFLTSQNVGEVTHNGKYESVTTDAMLSALRSETSTVRDVMAVALAGQLSHPVQWIDTMDTMVRELGVREVVEIAPVPTVSEMFRRSSFDGVALECACFPRGE